MKEVRVSGGGGGRRVDLHNHDRGIIKSFFSLKKNEQHFIIGAQWRNLDFLSDKHQKIHASGISKLFLYRPKMTQRHFTEGEEILFVTTNTLHRYPFFVRRGYAREVIDTLYRVQKLHPFFLYGFVIMPDHLHLLVRVPHPYTISRLMSVLKSGVTANIGIPKLWQRRFFLIVPRHPFKVLNYIHMNPVKAGIVRFADEYPWSSASGRWDVSPLG